MHIYQRLVVVVIIGIILGCTTFAWGDDNIVLSIRQAYEEGNIDQAEFLALKALKQPQNLSSQELLEVHKLLAFCYVALDDHESAISEFFDVLDLNPRLTLDPVYVSPKIIEVFETAKVQYQSDVATREKPITPQQVRLNASMHSLIVPGWGQIKKGQPTRGYAFMAAQGITLGAWIGLVFITNDRQDEYQNQTVESKIEDNYQDYKSALRWRNSMGLAALVVYISSFLDTLYGPEPHLTTSLSVGYNPTSTPCVTLTIPF